MELRNLARCIGLVAASLSLTGCNTGKTSAEQAALWQTQQSQVRELAKLANENGAAWMLTANWDGKLKGHWQQSLILDTGGRIQMVVFGNAASQRPLRVDAEGGTE